VATWQLTGDYFENCNCDVVCPCFASSVAPLTSRPSRGACDVALIFHVDKGTYGDVTLDGLNVAVIMHAPGPMADGNFTAAAYIDERADDRQTGALAAIFTGVEGGPMAAFAPLIATQLGVKKGADPLFHSREEPVIGNTRHHADGRRADSDHASERRDLDDARPPRRTRQDRAGDGQKRQHVCRLRDALGQFRQERPLRPNHLVELAR